MIQDIVRTLLAWGPLGVLVISTLDSAGIPIPGGVDALLIVLATQTGTVTYWSAALAVAGSVAGNLVLFYLARRGGEAYLERHTLSERGRRFRRWFRDYGLLTVFIPALVPAPLPMKIFVISAGVAGVSLRKFLLVVFVARVPRYFGLVFLGIQMGEYPMQFLWENALTMLLISVGLFAVLYLIIKMKHRSRERAGAIG